MGVDPWIGVVTLPELVVGVPPGVPGEPPLPPLGGVPVLAMTLVDGTGDSLSET